MSSKAAEMLGHPPGLNFRPDDDELVEFFLLPRVRGEPAWFPGVVVIDDDTAANTHPLNLLERHGLAGDDNAYFFVHTNDAAARQDRYCAGGGRWVSQRPVPKGSCIGGQEIKWRRVNLNLQPGRGKSTGWVMHEYTLTDPPCPFLKICHVTFTGHGKDAKRVPDGESGCQTGEPASKRARIDPAAAATANSGSSTCQVYGSTAPAMDQGYGAYFPIDQGMSASSQQLLDGTYLPANAMPYMEFEEMQDSQHQPLQSFPYAASAGQQVQHQPINQQLQPVQSYSAACVYGSTMTVADQDSSAAAAHAYAMVPQMTTSGEDGGIAQSNQQLILHGTYLPADAVPCMGLEERLQTTTDQVIQDAQLQSVESSFWSFPSATELFLDTSTAEPQHGLDEQEKKFWRSIGVDTDNIAF